jgi:hypothetical protein
MLLLERVCHGFRDTGRTRWFWRQLSPRMLDPPVTHFPMSKQAEKVQGGGWGSMAVTQTNGEAQALGMVLVWRRHRDDWHGCAARGAQLMRHGWGGLCIETAGGGCGEVHTVARESETAQKLAR